jgi:hypothetical protein
VAALGGDLRLKLLRLAPRLAFHASLLVGTTLGDAVSDVAALPADTPRSSRAPSLLLAPGLGVRWAFGPAGVAAFLAEVRALGASHLALTFGAGLAF